jgi:uncharacterized membrane protein
MPDQTDQKIRAKRQGNRLGIFLVVLGLVLALIGILNQTSFEEPTWVTVTRAFGVALLIFGYPLARLWFWFRAA